MRPAAASSAWSRGIALMMKNDSPGIQKNQVKNAIQKLITPLKANGPVLTNGMALTTKNDKMVIQPHQLTMFGTSFFSRLSRMNTMLAPAICHEVTKYAKSIRSQPNQYNVCAMPGLMLSISCAAVSQIAHAVMIGAQVI